jgi:hypothetical protein
MFQLRICASHCNDTGPFLRDFSQSEATLSPPRHKTGWRAGNSFWRRAQRGAR